VGVQSIAVSMSVCSSVCPLYLHISKTKCPNFTKFSVARSSADVSAICVLLVLWMILG